MIEITDKSYCCGCTACIQVCPQTCIKHVIDEEGFTYPVVDKGSCVGCGLCEEVCPCLNETHNNRAEFVYAAINKNERIRMASSSGGVFSALAKNVLKRKGCVYGAAFNKKWEVVHICVDDEQDLHRLYGSKYVQSRIDNIFKDVKHKLDDGKDVLFTGTPCQIKGLKLYLRKEYDNLISVEVVCHGVPSPKVWDTFLMEINPNEKEITSIQMRDKSRGWTSYSIEIKAGEDKLFSNYARNCLYIKGFIRNLTIRPSCFNCPAKSGSSMADISLADFWGIVSKETLFSDNKGVSAVLVYTDKGETAIMNSSLELRPTELSTVVNKNNRSYIECPKLTSDRELFWRLFPSKGLSAITEIRDCTIQPFYKRITKKVKRMLLG